jgi:hypothetical protein
VQIGRKRGFWLLSYVLLCLYSYSCSYYLLDYILHQSIAFLSESVCLCRVPNNSDRLSYITVGNGSASNRGASFPHRLQDKTTGCTSVAELHQQQGSSTHRQASCCSAISPRLRARHIRQPTSYLYHSPKRSHQDHQPQLGYSGQHGSRAHLRSWLPRARGHAHPAHQGQCFADVCTENCRNE